MRAMRDTVKTWELVQQRSAHRSRRPDSLIACSDAAGVVREVGEGVHGFQPGDHVAANFFETWFSGPFLPGYHATTRGGGMDGVLAEAIAVDARSVVKMPAALSFEQAATLPCAAVTAWHALFETQPLRPGQTVLVQGTGGVSIFGLQLAKAAGARVIVTSSSDAKLEKAKALGADFGINYRQTPAWGVKALELTHGLGVDHVIDVGGPETFDQSVEALRYQGHLSLLGVLTGVKGTVNTYGFFHKALRATGIYVGSTEMFEALVRTVDQHRLVPQVDRVFGFDEARAAYEYLGSAQHFGKVVIRVG
jgi:NADPH:quinone reductase-like Zn-dependent oxidoreductase